MRYPFASMLIADIAPSMGISVELEPEYKFAGELVFADGRRHLFRNTNFNVNPAGSTEIAKDKAYTSYFLRKHGFKVPDNKAFFSDKLNNNLPEERRRGRNSAIQYAVAMGLPVFVKPNNLSQGAFVTKAHSIEEIERVAKQIFEKTNVLLIEEFCAGHDYRIVVLGDAIISAYQRVPLSVVGDGKHTIDQLLEFERDKLKSLGRPNSEINPSDPRIDSKLLVLGKSKSSIPFLGENLTLMDSANLSTGGTSVDITDSIHTSFSEIAIKATKALGLKLCGVDIITNDLAHDASNQGWHIIEMNAAPGLDNYASIGIAQQERVKSLYRQILEHLAMQYA